jgi:hypothetical protein
MERTIVFSFLKNRCVIYDAKMWRDKMSKDKKAARLKEIDEYLDILVKDGFLSALPDGTLIELHQALGTAVAVIQHLEQGED